MYDISEGVPVLVILSVKIVLALFKEIKTMARSYWKLHLNSQSKEGAKKILNNRIKAINRLPMESTIEKYFKGGYMATLEFNHYEELSWPEVLVEVIEFGQKIGGSWALTGKIGMDPSAILSKNAGSHISISGLEWAEWQVSNE